ncbi:MULTISPECIES: hypothetical protein [Blautia]|uniref:hypothetical protein n=1 Tax=Blautia TaxID=572511 RepID=UPI000BA3B25E|nr:MULTISPECIES: hypothetical protein [Blautia]
MKAVKKIEISVLHKRITPIVYAVQGDTGREIECTVVDWDIPAGVTARVWVVKPSKKVVYNDCRIVDKAVFVPMTNQTLAEPGGAICMIEFVSGEDVVSSFSFNLYVYESASGDGIPSENESTVLEGMFKELAQDAIKTLNEAKAQAAAAKKSAQDTEKIKNDFTLTAQQAVADVNNAGQTQTQRVNTAGDTQVSRIQAEGTTQIQNVQATAAEIAADREQIHTNRDNTARLQRTTAGAITRSAEGSFITLEDAADEMGFKRIEIPGMTEQRTTTGAQLFDASKLPTATANGATVTNNGDGSFTISGTPTASGGISYYAYSHDESVKLFPAGTYTLKCEKATRPYFYLTFSYTGGRVELNNNSTTILTKDITEDMVNTANYQVTFGFYVNIETTLQIGTIRPMLYCDGDGTWEPYTGNKPSPSPEYPQELENVGVLNEAGKYKVKIAACKNNLLDMTGAKGGTDAGITAVVNPDGTFTSNGTTTGAAINIWLLGGYYPDFTDKDVLMVLAPGKTYYLADVALFMGTENTATQVFFVDPKKYPKGFKVTGVRHPAKNVGTVLTNKTHYPRVILGDTDTGWEPYRGHTATITSDRPLTKWDKLTCRDGVWGWRYKGFTVVEDGSRLISDTWWPSVVFSTLPKRATNSKIYCNYCASSYIRASNAYGTNICIEHADTYWEFTNSEETKAWLIQKNTEGKPLYYQYETLEEEWVPLSAEEQAAMNALCTHAGTTHIWTDDPLQPVISVDYTLDTEGYIRDTTPAYRDVERFALTGEASGTVATCTDSADWPLLGVGMLGKCEQVTTTGAQLFDFTWEESTSGSIRYINNNGVITANGTLTEPSSYTAATSIILLPGTYSVSGNHGYAKVYVRIKKADDTIIYINGSSFAVDGTEKEIKFFVQIDAPKGTGINYTLYPMLNAGETAHPWERYTGAAPSPSPAYKQEIQETGTYNPETGMYEAVWQQCGDNIFDISLISDIDVSGNGSIRKGLVLPGGTDYILSAENTMTDIFWKKVINGTYGGANALGADGIIRAQDATTVMVYAQYINQFTDLIHPMLNAGETAQPWEPYQSDTLRLTADQPWRGIGDIHDEVCDRNGVLGTWRRYAEDILDGSEDEKWGMADCLDPTHKRFYSYLVSSKANPAENNASVEPLLCNAYKAVTANKAYAENQGISVEAATGKVLIYDNTFSLTADISGFKARLAEYPITVVYQLKEPYFEPFPDEIQKQYRKLKSYAGTTHAWADDPLQPEVSFRYVKDSKAVIKNLQLDIAEQITDLQAQIDQLTINNNL